MSESPHPASEADEIRFQPEKTKKEDVDMTCKWLGCTAETFHSLTSLVSHLTQVHLTPASHTINNAPVKYTCQWEGCSRFGIEQPSRFALISHCRTHTGEKPYFCPIPECEKHFTRSDALAKHVKGVHDLHLTKDALVIIKDRVKKGQLDLRKQLNADDNDYTSAITEDSYTKIVHDDFDLRTPWWFKKDFVDGLSCTDTSLASLTDLPFDTKQYRVANNRYKLYLADQDEELVHGPADDETLAAFDASINMSSKPVHSNGFEHESLEQEYHSLRAKLATASKINKIVTTELAQSVKIKRKIWLINQVLLDANVKLGLPVEGPPAEFQTALDDIDDAILTEGVKIGSSS